MKTFNELSRTLPLIAAEQMAQYSGPLAPEVGGYLETADGRLQMIADGRDQSGITYDDADYVGWYVD